MKTKRESGKLLFMLLLAVILLICSACGTAPSDEIQFLLPPIVENNDHYHESDPSELDEEQVAAFQSDNDAYPDVDVYVFEYDGDPEEYAQKQAMLFGTQAFPTEIGGTAGFGFVSVELYDDGWTVVTDIVCTLDETHLEEICLFDKAQPISIAGPELCVHIPTCYEPADKAKEAGVVQSYTQARSEEYSMGLDAHRIDTVFVEGVSPNKLLPELKEEYGADYEYVTINGRNFYVLYGTVKDTGEYVKAYYFQGENGTSGVRFFFDGRPNGFDNAVMCTIGLY